MVRKQFGRPRPKRRLGKKFIIVCEGAKTEVGYFHAIRQELRRPTLEIMVVHPDATDPKRLVQAAIEKVETQKSEGNWLTDDIAWAVFDGDEHIQSKPANWKSALDLASKHNIQLAISNPSFELWYLLHFADQNANISRQNVIRELKKHLPKYRKNLTLYPDPLTKLTENAVNRAKTLDTQITNNLQTAFTNPSTYVFQLVEELHKL